MWIIDPTELRIPCQWNLNSRFILKAQDFGFHEQKCLGFKKLDFLTYADINLFFFSIFVLHFTMIIIGYSLS